MKRRSKLAERKEMLDREYQEVHNNSTMMKDSRVNDTNDDMIEMNDLSGGLIFNESKGKDLNAKKLSPSHSKLYKENTERIKKGLMPLEEEKRLESGPDDDVISRSKFQKLTVNDDSGSKSNSGSSKSKNSDDDEFEKLRRIEDNLEEETHYYFRNLFIQGSLFQNFIWMDSYINPRHVRGTLWYTNTIFIWYYCAVVFNNSRDPKRVPDFDRKTRELTFNEFWVSFTAPWAAMIFVYIFCLIMRVSNERLRYTRTVKYLDYIMDEYRREHVLRYLMGYFIVIAVNVMVFIYLIQFTAIHGWKTSWIWWNTGSLGFFLNTLVFDPACAAAHWAIYK
jgi:hypothetical protein